MKKRCTVPRNFIYEAQTGGPASESQHRFSHERAVEPQVRSFLCIASVSPSVKEAERSDQLARHLGSSGHTHPGSSSLLAEMRSGLETRRPGRLSRKHLLHRDPAITRTLTGQIPRGVSANVLNATGLRWWTRMSVNSKPHLPLDLNYVKKRLKTGNKRALTSSHMM